MSEYKIQAKSLSGYIRSLSGLFMTKENPHGLSPKECTILTVLRFKLDTKDKVVTKEVKEYVSNELNQTMQVTINYINKFKRKNVIIKAGGLHPVFYNNKIVIEYGEQL